MHLRLKVVPLFLETLVRSIAFQVALSLILIYACCLVHSWVSPVRVSYHEMLNTVLTFYRRLRHI